MHWIGLDSRPLAVGSQLVVTLDIATDAGSTPPYTVSSSNPEILTVLDAGDQRILLDVIGAGIATLELNAAGAKSDLAVTTEVGVAISIWDAQRYAAGIGVALDPKFALDLLANSQEVLQGVVLDADCQPLNSWGLVQGYSPTGQVTVSPRPPEQFVLASGANPFNGAAVNFALTSLDAGLPASDGGAIDSACNGDAGSFVSLSNLSVVSSAASVGLSSAAPEGLVIAAKAYASDGTEVFGIDDWEFSCSPATTCVVMPFSPSVIGVSIPSNSGPHAVTASSPSQGLTTKPPLTIQ